MACKNRSGEIIYIKFLHDGLSSIGIYSEELDPENFYLQWPARTKIQHMYRKLLKDGNGDNEF